MSTPPVAFNRLKQIATDVCNNAIGTAEFYDHSKTEQWNSAIISSMLKAVISESTPQGSAAPAYKFACNSTIVQHLVPTSSLNKARGGTDTKTEQPHVSTSSESDDAGSAGSTTANASAAAATSTDGKPHVGRRGMHSATGAYWDEKKDGMWTFKYGGGEGKGMDVVIMLIWIAI
ncbi:Dynein light chain Tctex-type [Escovopsis weberi]|uniref:Dynein light chain Tctex-type n=1 Tax=Escovopsis weberi TaxID=150374 RepID=A0A0M9VUW0_ESCWE|nr:Dynein light chain Tctex-type [Escovopsis weberi]